MLLSHNLVLQETKLLSPSEYETWNMVLSQNLVLQDVELVSPPRYET